MSDIPATGRPETSRRAFPRLVFFGGTALLFAASVTITLARCASMSAMGDLPMPGGWAMSMTWRPLCGRGWFSVAASFAGMWAVMMVAMMLPSLGPVLWRYWDALSRAGERRPGRLTLLVGVGYFSVWTAPGMAAFVLGAALAALEMHVPALARAVPVGAGVAVLAAGALQFTAWKAQHLACCREARGCGGLVPAQAPAPAPAQAQAGSAWRYGLRLGLHCNYCCAGLTVLLLVLGVMDPRVMAVVTAAITVERLAPDGERVARVIGAVVVGAGLVLIARGMGIG
jgi:predicted metal-binding membrane protein